MELKSFNKHMDLPIEHLNCILHIEATGGKIPYLRYVELNLQVPGVKAFDEDVLILVLEDSDYSKRVSIQSEPCTFSRS